MDTVTTIQFFEQSWVNQTSETEFEEVIGYSANVVINDLFLVQLSGGDRSCEASIPYSDEMMWKEASSQDEAATSYEDLDRLLSLWGVENNYDWLKENANEQY